MVGNSPKSTSVGITRRARGRSWAVRGGIATAVLSVALVAPGVNEYALRQIAGLAQPAIARQWFTQTQIPLSDAPPEQGMSRWVLPPALAEAGFWRWDDATVRWLDTQAHRLPTALKSLKKINTIYLLPRDTMRKEIRQEDQLLWTLVDSQERTEECGATYSTSHGIEIAFTRTCLDPHNDVSLAKVIHELVHAWDLERGEELAPVWDQKRGQWAQRSLSTWDEDPQSWAKLSWYPRAGTGEWTQRTDRAAEKFVNARAKLSPLEDLAETAEQYFLDSQQIERRAPRKAEWLKARLFLGESVPDLSHGKKK